MKIAATVNNCIQVGPDDYSMQSFTKVFSTDSSIEMILNWARIKFKTSTLTINDIKFSEVDDE